MPFPCTSQRVLEWKSMRHICVREEIQWRSMSCANNFTLRSDTIRDRSISPCSVPRHVVAPFEWKSKAISYFKTHFPHKSSLMLPKFNAFYLTYEANRDPRVQLNYLVKYLWNDSVHFKIRSWKVAWGQSFEIKLGPFERPLLSSFK